MDMIKQLLAEHGTLDVHIYSPCPISLPKYIFSGSIDSLYIYRLLLDIEKLYEFSNLNIPLLMKTPYFTIAYRKYENIYKFYDISESLSRDAIRRYLKFDLTKFEKDDIRIYEILKLI